MITGIAHACYTVSDLDAAEAFYVQKLGLSKAFDFINDEGKRFGVYIRVGRRTFVELFTGTPQAGESKGSYRHLCLEVDNLKQTVAELRGRGVTVSEPVLGKDQSWQAWIADVDGNRIELHEYTAASWQAPHL